VWSAEKMAMAGPAALVIASVAKIYLLLFRSISPGSQTRGYFIIL